MAEHLAKDVDGRYRIAGLNLHVCLLEDLVIELCRVASWADEIVGCGVDWTAEPGYFRGIVACPDQIIVSGSKVQYSSHSHLLHCLRGLAYGVLKLKRGLGGGKLSLPWR